QNMEYRRLTALDKLYRIIDHLVRYNNGYTVYGFWRICYPHYIKLEHHQLKKILELKLDHVRYPLSRVNSFKLYAAQILDIKEQDEPTIEIFPNLEWDEYYRVFGFWKCKTCKKKWRSAYTWISLREFIFKTSAKKLKNYYMQQCINCNGDAKCSGEKKKDSDTSVIYKYEPLELSDGGKHKDHLCAKGQNSFSLD
ncbi:1992_t:CDS:2, partial [Acaulospora morrowiae]